MGFPSGAAGFCRGPLALGVLGGPVTPLSHPGADPCGETEAAACPALISLISGVGLSPCHPALWVWIQGEWEHQWSRHHWRCRQPCGPEKQHLLLVLAENQRGELCPGLLRFAGSQGPCLGSWTTDEIPWAFSSCGQAGG